MGGSGTIWPVIDRRRRKISPRYLCEDERVRMGGVYLHWRERGLSCLEATATTANPHERRDPVALS
jgi:hypothetical protein